VQPGNSGGPMLDEDGYVMGVVRMKLAADATSSGAGFAIPVRRVKDFLESNGLIERLPVARLHAGSATCWSGSSSPSTCPTAT
jgi:hypothetical protein